LTQPNISFIACPHARLWTHPIVTAVGTPRKPVFKAEMLGKHFIVGDPWGTTQLCHHYLEWVPN